MLLSVIVPFRNAERTIEQAVASVTGQALTDLEIVAVDDASTDASAQIVAALAEADPRIRVVSLSTRVRAGGARNAGLEAARGEYVAFLDADDWLEDGALTAVAARLEPRDIDVLIVGYVDETRTGTGVHDPNGVLAGAPDGIFPPAEYTAVLSVSPLAWNKVYRRSYLDDAEIRFPTGSLEGLPFTVAALLLTEHVSVLPDVCHHRRKRDARLATPVVGKRHFDLVEQWDRVFTFLDEHPDAARWRSLLFDQMTAEFARILRTLRGLAEGENRRFFDAAADLSARVRPAEHVAPSGQAGVAQASLVDHDVAAFDVRAERPRSPLTPYVARVRRVGGRGLIGLRSAQRRFLYRMYRRRPVLQDLVVFAATSRHGFGDGPHAMLEALERVAPGRFRTVWVIGDNVEAQAADPAAVRPQSPAGLEALARCAFIIYDDLLPAWFVKRSGQTIVQTMKHPPLKTEGVDLSRYPAVRRRSFSRTLTECDRWDVVLSPNQYASEIWQRSYPSRYRLFESGLPHTDAFVGGTEAVRLRVRKTLGVEDGMTVVLYAPTARDYLRKTELPVSLERLARSLPDGFVLAVRPPADVVWDHYVEALVHGGHGVDASALSRTEACIAADVLLTDYSSIVFDVACLDRPIVVLADDLDTFRRVRGLYLDITTEGPGVVVRSTNELTELLAAGDHDGPEARERRSAFRDRFCATADGQAGERAVRALLLGDDVAIPAWTTASAPTAALESA